MNPSVSDPDNQGKPQPVGGQNGTELLRVLVEGTAGVTGREFFRSLARHTAKALGVRYTFLAECLENNRARALAFWAGSDYGPDFNYDLTGTPCAGVVRGEICHYGDCLQQLFPADSELVPMAAQSYLGVPLFDAQRQVIGHLVLIDDKPMPRDPLAVSVLEIFASRAGAELERQHADEELRRLAGEMEAVLNVNRAIGRHLQRTELFAALAASLRGVLHHERFGIELPMEGDRLQGHLLSQGDQGQPEIRVEVLAAAGTACHWVLQNRQWMVTSTREEIRERFPLTFAVMEREQMESLAALPLISGDRACGVLFFMAAAPAAYGQPRRGLVEQVASAVAAALDDCLTHEEFRRQASQALAESEERFRDLFDEAPIAYVHEGLDSQFVRANRAAMRSLGIRPEEVTGTFGKSFVPDTPEAQRRLREAFESIGRGTDASGVVLELRRKDNGKPLWIQWWSKPAPGGQYTRTMFIDITDRVLMEQEKARVEAQNTYLQEEIRSEHNFGEIVGNSPALLEVLRLVDQVAPAQSTALIIGETGTGKELIARAIHDRSKRSGRPLVKVNCGAISAGLVESELFGHVKGAFTGALAHRDGRFKVADGGTLFLDEVGELPLDTQVKLLRVLQEQEFEPIGSSKTLRVDVRIIAATNRDLSVAVAEGKFRRDLYYRLNVFPIEVPPLRLRASDVPLLVNFFLERFTKDFGKSRKRVLETTMRALTQYSWPGNIRELQNVIERAILLSPGDTLQLAADFTAVPAPPATAVSERAAFSGPPFSGDLASAPAPVASAAAAGGSSETADLESVERRHIESVLAQANWMIEGERGAARILNLNPSTLRSRMQKLGIRRPAR
jgi:PAS domain S-box-containing protein